MLGVPCWGPLSKGILLLGVYIRGPYYPSFPAEKGRCRLRRSLQRLPRTPLTRRHSSPSKRTANPHVCLSSPFGPPHTTYWGMACGLLLSPLVLRPCLHVGGSVSSTSEVIARPMPVAQAHRRQPQPTGDRNAPGRTAILNSPSSEPFQ